MNAPTPINSQQDIAQSVRLLLISVLCSLGLAFVKISVGLVGNSYALIADGIESLTDVISSIAVLLGLKFSVLPPDEKHPWGHGKLETLATLFVSGALLFAAGLIAWQSIGEIRGTHLPPEWYTLPVLLFVIFIKVAISRAISKRAKEQGSQALEADSWHHLSDALTSGAAVIGISISLIGGPGWEAADDWAALLACTVIFWNGIRFAHSTFQELLEARAPEHIEMELRKVAIEVDGVLDVEKLRTRKSGMGVIMDIHIEVDGELSVTEGHDIAGATKAALLDCGYSVTDVTVHVEPHPQ